MVLESLNSDASDLSPDRYFRLMCFSACEIVIILPLSLLVLLSQALTQSIFPWISWDDTHSDWNRFDQIPAILFDVNDRSYFSFAATLWVIPFLSYIFFVIFGVGRQQINQYRRWIYALLKPFGVEPPPPKPHDPSKRTWWQMLFCLPGPAKPSGCGLTTSGGPTHSLTVSHGVKSMRIGNPLASIGTALTFQLDDGHEKFLVVDKQPLPHDLEAGPARTVDLSRGGGDDGKYAMSLSTSSDSGVTGSSPATLAKPFGRGDTRN
jgi:hypothetical protein